MVSRSSLVSAVPGNTSILHDPCIRATQAPSSSLASHHQSPNPTNHRLCTRHTTMKQRFSSLDVKVSSHRRCYKEFVLIDSKVIAHELAAKLTSLRVTNVYDLSSVRVAHTAQPEHGRFTYSRMCREFSSSNSTSPTTANSCSSTRASAATLLNMRAPQLQHPRASSQSSANT